MLSSGNIDRVGARNAPSATVVSAKEIENGDELLVAASAMLLTDAEKAALRTRLDGDVYGETTRLFVRSRTSHEIDQEVAGDLRFNESIDPRSYPNHSGSLPGRHLMLQPRDSAKRLEDMQ